MNPAETVTINRACELAGVTRRTIYNWMQAGKLKTIRTAGGSIRIDPASLFRPANDPATQEVE